MKALYEVGAVFCMSFTATVLMDVIYVWARF